MLMPVKRKNRSARVFPISLHRLLSDGAKCMQEGRQKRRLAAGGDVERMMFWLFVVIAAVMWGVILVLDVDGWMSLSAASACSLAAVSLGFDMRRRSRAMERLDAAVDDATRA